MNKIIIANWKMQLTYKESLDWCNSNKNELNKIIKEKLINIVICPDYLSLNSIIDIVSLTDIKIGAQDCAFEEIGAYTGQVSSLSLKEIGCNYCIIGHSEQRLYSCQDYNIIAKKLVLLVKNNICPIVCIGETLEEYKSGKTLQTLEQQINYIIKALDGIKNIYNTKIYIAYEPLWAIGTGKSINPQELDLLIDKIYNYISTYIDTKNIYFLYGGSINSDNIESFKNITKINGFLLGKASIDFQKLKKIVLLY